VDKNGHLSRFVRFNIQGMSNKVLLNALAGVSNDHGPWHPVEKILDLFLTIDRLVIRSYFMACAKYLQGMENKIQDDASPNSLRDTTMSLVSLNTNPSKVCTTLKYLHTSIAVLKLNTPELETPRHREVLGKDLQRQGEKYLWDNLKYPLLRSERSDRAQLKPKVEEEFEKANWHSPGLKYNLEQLDMIVVQRLLDVESAQQRMDISLSVVSSALSSIVMNINSTITRHPLS
jgi:hypothetical protein